MGSILPVRFPPLGWTFFALFFYASLVLVSWGASSVLGIEVEYPGPWDVRWRKLIPLFALSFTLTALIRGGLEEPGWRGMLLPELQKKSSPLVVLQFLDRRGVVALASPLYLNGFLHRPVGRRNAWGFRVPHPPGHLLDLGLQPDLGGSMFCMIVLHTSFNRVANFIPTADVTLLGLWLIVVVAVVLKDKMYRKLPGVAMEHPLA